MLKRPKVPPTLFDALLSSSSSSLELVPVVLLLLDDVVDLELVFGLDEASTPFIFGGMRSSENEEIVMKP